MSKCTITDISGDLFTAPDDISLAHCVSADLTMGAGIAVLIKRKYDRVIELKRQNVTTGGVAVLQHEKRFIYYLVTKDRSIHKPTYENLGRSLTAMRHHMLANNVKKVAMPRIGCGIDGMVWDKVVDQLTAVFGEDEVELIVYDFVPK